MRLIRHDLIRFQHTLIEYLQERLAELVGQGLDQAEEVKVSTHVAGDGSLTLHFDLLTALRQFQVYLFLDAPLLPGPQGKRNFQHLRIVFAKNRESWHQPDQLRSGLTYYVHGDAPVHAAELFAQYIAEFFTTGEPPKHESIKSSLLTIAIGHGHQHHLASRPVAYS